MQRDFQKWHFKKERIDGAERRLFFHEREIWWCAVGVNIGFEQDGRGERFARPVLVFKKFNNEVFWAIPLSTKIEIPAASCGVLPEEHLRSFAQLLCFAPRNACAKGRDLYFLPPLRFGAGILPEKIKTDPLRGPRVPNGNL